MGLKKLLIPGRDALYVERSWYRSPSSEEQIAGPLSISGKR